MVPLLCNGTRSVYKPSSFGRSEQQNRGGRHRPRRGEEPGGGEEESCCVSALTVPQHHPERAVCQERTASNIGMALENEPSTESEPVMRVVSHDAGGTTADGGVSSDAGEGTEGGDTVESADKPAITEKDTTKGEEIEKIEVKPEQGSAGEAAKIESTGEGVSGESATKDVKEATEQETKPEENQETKQEVKKEEAAKETQSESIASTPKPAIRQRSLAQIKTLYPIDAKLLQYCYVYRKLVSFIMIVKRTKEALANPATPLVDPQSVILLSGPIFNINDNFYRRSELLQNMQKYNPAQTVDVSLILSPISFDSLENISRNSPVNPYGIALGKAVPLPNRKKILDTMALLELLLLSVYEVVDAKLNTALNQVNRQHGTKETKQSITQNLSPLKFPELSVVDQLTFSDIPNIPSTKQESILRYYLKSQFHFLEIKLAMFQNIIDELKVGVHRTTSLVTKSKTIAQKPQSLTPLYTMYTLLLRISDMYIEIRKTGKTIYFQNVNYFSPYSRSRKTVREALARMSIYFTHSKQNSMVLTLISKYARRTEIKNISLDSNIFVSEFRKTSLETIALLDKMMAALREIHNEWTFILTDGKDSEFSKETLREKLRERVNSDREKRLRVLFENQKEMKVQMEHLRAGSVTPSDVSNNRSRLANRRISSMGSIGSIDENASLNTNNSTNGNRVTRRLSISGIPSQQGSASSSPSLTSSSRSPFYRQASNSSGSGSVSASTSRSNSLTSTSASRRMVSRRSSVGDLHGENKPAKLADMSSIAESSVFVEPPKIGHTVQRKSSYGSITSGSSPSSRTSSLTRQSISRGVRSPSLTSKHATPSGSPILTRRSSVVGSSPSISRRTTANNSRCNSLTSSPNIQSPGTAQRRASVIPPHASSPSLRSQAAGNANGNGTIRRKPSINAMPSAPNESRETQMAKLAAKRVVPQNLTAQQRLQQHILKSTQNGSVYGKPLESRRPFVTKAGSPRSGELHMGDNDMVTQTQMHTETQTESLDEKLSDTLGALSVNPDLQVTPASPSRLHAPGSAGSDDVLTEFPGSPLNSLKASSLEAQNALKLQIMNRSRSNSNTNLSTPRATRTSPTKPSASPSPSRVRSRSNSALTKLVPVSRQTSLESSGSVSDLSRRSSVSSAAQGRTRSRSSSVIGNMDVVSESEVGGDFKVGTNGEIVKRVRFAGVSQYSEDEDAPTPQRIQKQIRQKWAAYKPLFRKLNSQEGLVFKQNHMDDDNGNGNGKVNYGGGLVTGPMNANGGGLGLNPNLVMGAQVQPNGKVLLMDAVTNHAESEAARNMSTMSLRRERKGILGNGSGNGGGSGGTGGNSGGITATARLSRLFRKR